MSEINVEDLKKLSVTQLKKFAKGVDGEELTLVNEVIKNKEKNSTNNGSELPVNDPGIQAEIDASKEKLKEREVREEAKAKADAVKEEAKAVIQAGKDKKKAERNALREEAIIEIAKKKALREEARKAKEEAKITAIKTREEEKLKRVDDAKAEVKTRELEKIQKEKDKKERALATAKSMQGMSFNTKPNKTKQIRECLAQGMTNAEINEATGFPNKFICDTVWRIERQIEDVQFTKEASEKLADEKKNSASKSED